VGLIRIAELARPPGRLVVPDERVSDDEEAERLAEGDEGIGRPMGPAFIAFVKAAVRFHRVPGGGNHSATLSAQGSRLARPDRATNCRRFGMAAPTQHAGTYSALIERDGTTRRRAGRRLVRTLGVPDGTFGVRPRDMDGMGGSPIIGVICLASGHRR
jgi:hypothetical protein